MSLSSSGLELCQFIRACDPLCAVVMYSGDIRTSVRQHVLAAGIQAFLAKPIELDELAVIERLTYRATS